MSIFASRASARLIALQYELALLVGQDLKLTPMLRRFFASALKLIGCKAAHVWLWNEQTAQFERRFSYPLRDATVWQTDARFAAAAATAHATPTQMRIISIGERIQLHCLPLNSIGYCIVVREGQPLETLLITALQPIFERLALACRASLDHEALEHVQAIATADHQRLSNVLESIGEIVFQTDADGRLLFLNPAWTHITGFAIDEGLGQVLMDFLVPKDRDLVWQSFQSAWHSEHYQSQRCEAQLQTRDHTQRCVTIRIRRYQPEPPSGTQPLRYNKPLRHGYHYTADAACRFTGTMIDITELKQAERMKQEFTATVSHELRTPLTSIVGAVALLKGGAVGSLPDAADKLVAIADKNCQRLRVLVDDLLDMEKLLVGKLLFVFEDIELRPLIEQSLNENQTFASTYGVNLRLSACPDPLWLRTDPDRFQQIMNNLLSNAIKFSPQGGDVVVQVQRVADAVRIEVCDNGPGIAPEFHDRVFEKFAQRDTSDRRSAGGTGLGLAITHALVEQMQGRIGFESTLGAGATFWFELPKSAA